MVRRGRTIAAAAIEQGDNKAGPALAPQHLIAAALAAGALRPEDVVHGGVVVEEVGRSHSVQRVSVAGIPRFFVKSFGASRGQTDGELHRERAMLRLAQSRPAVAALIPPEWPWHGPEAVIVTAAVAGAEAWSLDHSGGGSAAPADAWARVVRAVSGPLADFHRSTRDLARPGAEVTASLVGPEPWPLRLMDGDAPAELWATAATATTLAEAADDPALVAGLRAARSSWRSLALIHSDLKHDNLLIMDGADGLQVKIVDWEMARLGDPAWDLASLAARLAIARWDGVPWPDEDLDGAALLIELYSAASGLSSAALARRLILYAGAALLMTAIQHASTLGAGADRQDATRLLMTARSTFRRADRLTAGLLERLR